VHDGYRFILTNSGTIEQAPLQTYCSAILFSPSNSIIKRLFENGDASESSIHDEKGLFEDLSWIKSKPMVPETWGSLLQTIHGHQDSVNSVTFSPDGKMIASGSDDQTIRIWNANTGMLLCTLRDDSGIIHSIAFSPDGERVISGSSGGIVNVWIVKTGLLKYTLQGHSEQVNSVAVSPVSISRIASGSDDHTVRVWNAETEATLWMDKGHSGKVNSVAFSPGKGEWIASGSSDGTIRICLAETGELLKTVKTPGDYPIDINTVAFSPDSGRRIAYGSSDGTIRMWNYTTEVQSVIGEHFHSVNSVAFSPDGGKLIASGSGDDKIRIWNAQTGLLMETLEGHTRFIESVAFSPFDGARIISGSGDDTIRSWDTEANGGMQMPEKDSHFVLSLEFSPEGDMIVCKKSNGTLEILDVETCKSVHILGDIRHKDRIESFHFSSNGDKVLCRYKSRIMEIWDIRKGKLLKRLHSFCYAVDSTSNMTRVAYSYWSSMEGDSIGIWDFETSEQLLTLPVDSIIEDLKLSPRGEIVVFRCQYFYTRVWDVRHGIIMPILDEIPLSVEFVTGGEGINFRLKDGSVLVWDSRTGNKVRTTGVSPQPRLSSSTEDININFQERWVMYGEKRLLLLSGKSWSQQTATHGSKVAIESASKMVMIIEFDMERIQRS
jgi:WD40 repeat protein